MALFKCTKKILEEKHIDVFSNGKHTRDSTYTDVLKKPQVKKLK